MPFQQQLNMRTLVIDLDGVLVESVWQRRHGWKTVKRPGVEAFFETMAQYFEIVVFSDRAHSYVEPILNRIDPGIQTNQGAVIMYRLYRNSTQWRVRSSTTRWFSPLFSAVPPHF
jgi:import inner membrane translocase subunit TIM50